MDAIKMSVGVGDHGRDDTEFGDPVRDRSAIMTRAQNMILFTVNVSGPDYAVLRTGAMDDLVRPDQ